MDDSTRHRMPAVPTTRNLVSNKVDNSPGTHRALDGEHLPRREENKGALTLASTFNVNRYVTKKTATQGMLDVALLLANVSQLKRLLQQGPQYDFYAFVMVLVILSIIVQVLVGLILVWLSIKTIDKEENQLSLDRLNNAATFAVFIITVLNIFISTFAIPLKPHVL